MARQIALDASALAPERSEHGVHEIAPDLAYLRVVFVNVIFVGVAHAGDRNWVLVDAGVLGSAEQIRNAAHSRFGAAARPSAIVMTHGHFDHVGALEQLAEEWDCPVYAHPLELPYLNGTGEYPPSDPSVGGLMARLSPLYPRGPVDVSERLQALPADGSVQFMQGWRWIATPGHAPGHISLWRDSDRSIIAGDAFVTTGQESAYEALVTQEPEMHGPPAYFTPDWISAERSVQALAALEPELAITGHGRPLAGPLLRQSLHQLAAQFRSIAVPEHGRYVPPS